jgi:hypothetical protein
MDKRNVTGGGATLLQVIGMGSINIAVELEVIYGLRNKGQSRVGDRNIKRDDGQGRHGFGPPIKNTPVDGLAKIDGGTFEAGVVKFGGGSGKLCKRGDGVAYVRSRGDIGIKKFTKEGSVGKRPMSVARRACLGVPLAWPGVWYRFWMTEVGNGSDGRAPGLGLSMVGVSQLWAARSRRM